MNQPPLASSIAAGWDLFIIVLSRLPVTPLFRRTPPPPLACADAVQPGGADVAAPRDELTAPAAVR